MSCPVCRSGDFFVKDPQDPYITYPFALGPGLRNRTIRFDPSLTPGETPELASDTEVFCNCCSWHGRFKTLTSEPS